MTKAMEKGNALENAVKAIEHVILKSSSGLEKDSFLIESKKIINVDGVRHEIDIWVDIDHGKGYKSIFIFECKNWESNVGKNEIIIFSEKIDVVQAQKGFFVAKNFTKDAEAQAKKDKRINLLYATEYPIENMPIPFDFHFVLREKNHVEVHIDGRKFNKNRARRLNLEKVKCVINGQPSDFKNYIDEWTRVCSEKRVNTFPSNKKEEGRYELEVSDERNFKKRELFLDGHDIRAIKLFVKLSVRVVRPGVISHYEVHTRGRILSLAPVDLDDGGHIQVGFVGDPIQAQPDNQADGKSR